eukprot:15449123-Alexandrium_andersonii.AAC.1
MVVGDNLGVVRFGAARARLRRQARMRPSATPSAPPHGAGCGWSGRRFVAILMKRPIASPPWPCTGLRPFVAEPAFTHGRQ